MVKSTKKSLPKKNDSDHFSLFKKRRIDFYESYELIIALMAHKSSASAAAKLYLDPTSFAHRLTRQGLRHSSIKLTQLMAGASRHNADKVLSYLLTLDAVSLPSYYRRPPLEKAYKDYNSLLRNANTAANPELFYLTRVLAAICSTSTKTEAASLLELTVSTLFEYLNENNLAYSHIKNTYQDCNENKNFCVSIPSLSSTSLSSSSTGSNTTIALTDHSETERSITSTSSSSQMGDHSPVSVYSDFDHDNLVEQNDHWSSLVTSPMTISISPELFTTTQFLGLFAQSNYVPDSELDFDNLESDWLLGAGSV